MKPSIKQTDLGVLPIDWDIVPFSELLEFRNGVNTDKTAYGHGVRFVNVLEIITKSHLKAVDVPGRVSLPRHLNQQYQVQAGDVVFNRTSETQAEVGLAAVYLDNEDVVFGGFVIRGRPKGRDKLDALYSGYGLRSPVVRNQVVARGQGGIRSNVGQHDLRRVLVPLPPLHEQRAIAAALNDVDALIVALDQLIVKKRDIKQATMQQLLTGQSRLPGFKGKWKSKRVDEMGDVLAGKALDASGHGKARPYLRTKNVLDGRIDLDDVLEMPMTDSEFERFRLLDGDVLLNEGQSLDLVGRCSMYRDELGKPCAMQNQLLRFRARTSASPAFAEHLFRRCQASGIFSAIATQTTSVAHLGTLRFSSLCLSWPIDPAEQAAIATVLSDMDAEIAALEQRRDKTRLLKQGMMQELLTGRTRLV